VNNIVVNQTSIGVAAVPAARIELYYNNVHNGRTVQVLGPDERL